MKNHIVKAIITGILLLGLMGTASAETSPYSDLPAEHWAYKAVNKLSEAGIVSGYSDGAFRGDKTMTRYEMALVVANAMTKQDKADAQQKATIDKLATEFSAELKSFGVRVTKLEANQPRVTFDGSLMIRQTNRYNDVTNANTQHLKIVQEYNVQLNGTAKVDKNTDFKFRFMNATPSPANFAAGNTVPFGNSGLKDITDIDYNGPLIDQAYINTHIKDVNLAIGRQQFKLDSFLAWMASDTMNFDGITASTQLDKFNVSTSFGHFFKDVTWAGAKATGALQTKVDSLDVASGAVGSQWGKLDLLAGYYAMKNPDTKKYPFKWTLVESKYQFAKNLSLTATYINNNAAANDLLYPGKSTEGFGYKLLIGDQKLNREGAKNLGIVFIKKGANVVPNQLATVGTTPGNSDAANALDYSKYFFQAGYAWSKNFNTTFMYNRCYTEDAGKSIAGANNHFYRIINVVRF